MSDNPYEPPRAPLHDARDETAAKHRLQVESRQSYVNRLLNRGIVFSLIWIMGFGSIYSVLLALKARRMIRESDGKLHGMMQVRWCFIVGGFGIFVLGMVIVAAMLND